MFGNETAFFGYNYYEVYWHEKSRTYRFKSDCESPVNKGGSEGVWKYRWLLK